jgi:hypothetical protein
MKQLTWVVAVLGACAAVPARADVVVTGMELVREGSAGRGDERPRVVHLCPRGIRMDQGEESHVVDARKQLLLEVDHHARTVRTLTFKQLGEMTQKARKEADDALARARTQLSAMPPDIRVQVENAIRAQKSAAAAREPGAYKREKTGKKRTVGALACEDIKEILNGEWVGNSCVHTAVQLAGADRAMLLKLAQDMGKAGLAGGQEGEFTRAFLDGIPVEMSSRDPRTGSLVVEERVTKIEKKPVDEALFEVPAGYRVVPWEDPAAHAPPQGTRR